MREIGGRALVDGEASGPAVVLHEELSFWGGYDVASGCIIGRHPQAGTPLQGRVVVMPSGRGSSSSSSVLAEAIRAGTAPSGIVLAEADPVLVLGAVVAAELYGLEMPVVVVEDDDYPIVSRATALSITTGGKISID